MEQPSGAKPDTGPRWDENVMGLLAIGAAAEAARSSGLLVALNEGPATAESFAARLGLDVRAVTRVLDVLVAAGVVAKVEVPGQGAGYGPATSLLSFGRNMPGGLQGALALFGHTSAFLRSGEPLMAMDASAPARGAAYRSVVGDLGRMFGGVAAELAAMLDVSATDILDVGCGSGVWGLAIAARRPGARVTGLDLPPVLAAFETRAAELGLSDRIALLPGDMHEVEIPEGRFDLAIIANVLRLEQAPQARSVVARVAAALRPGGHLLVLDALAGGTPKKELSRAVYALNLALRTKEGTVHSPGEIRAWMADAGIREVRELELGESPGAVGALLGQKG